MKLLDLIRELQSLSPEKQIDRLKVLKESATTEELAILQIAALESGNAWLRSALLDITNSEKIVATKQIQPQATEQVIDLDAVKSEARSESIGQIIHELDPIIGSICVFAKSEIPNFEDSKTKAELDKLNEVIEIFEDWRRVEQPPKYKDVNVFLEIEKEVARIFDISKVNIQIDFPKDLTFVLSPALFRIIISNALRNAVESSNQPTIREKHPIILRGSATDKFLWLSIIDDGLGLQDTKEVLLKSRYSTKPGNRGLGLAIVAKAINSVGGNWDLKNSKPYGAEFYFELPKRDLF